jgi:hypothetical protein
MAGSPQPLSSSLFPLFTTSLFHPFLISLFYAFTFHLPRAAPGCSAVRVKRGRGTGEPKTERSQGEEVGSISSVLLGVRDSGWSEKILKIFFAKFACNFGASR